MSEKRPLPLSFPNFLLVDSGGEAMTFAEPGHRSAGVQFTQADTAHEFRLAGRPAMSERFIDNGRLLTRLRQLQHARVPDVFIDPPSTEELGTAVPIETIINALEE